MLDMFTKDAPSFDPKDVEDTKVICGISYLWILFFLPLVTNPKSAFGRYTANQALLLFIVSFAVGVVTSVISFIFAWIPVVGTLVGALVYLVNLLPLAVLIICLVLTLQGKVIRLPVIGHITLIK